MEATDQHQPFSEDELLAADRQRAADKDSGMLQQREEEAALREQVNRQERGA